MEPMGHGVGVPGCSFPWRHNARIESLRGLDRSARDRRSRGRSRAFALRDEVTFAARDGNARLVYLMMRESRSRGCRTRVRLVFMWDLTVGSTDTRNLSRLLEIESSADSSRAINYSRDSRAIRLIYPHQRSPRINNGCLECDRSREFGF